MTEWLNRLVYRLGWQFASGFFSCLHEEWGCHPADLTNGGHR